MLKIAFLFLVVTDIAHEQLWQLFLKGNEKKYSIYVHAKNPLSDSAFFKPFEMKKRVSTTWANTMRAQIALLQEALKDPNNYKFVFVSETTIPLRSFGHVYTTLTERPESMFHFMPNPHANRNTHEFNPKSQRDLQPLPAHQQYKNPQWIVLNRKHAECMVNDTHYIAITDQHESDNELYPATFLIAQGYAQEIIPVDMTYVEWNKKTNRRDVKRSPYLFCNFADPEEMSIVQRALKQGYLFIRKIDRWCNLTPLKLFLDYCTPVVVTA